MENVTLKKITVGEIYAYGRPSTDNKLKVPSEPTKLCYIYGAVTGAVIKPSKFDDKQQMLMGRFEGVRVSDRQVFTSERLYLPDNDHQNALAALCGPDEKTGEIREPEFALMIGYRADGKSPTGYVFTVESITDTRAQDRLASVRQQLSSTKLLERFNLPALPDQSGGKKK